MPPQWRPNTDQRFACLVGRKVRRLTTVQESSVFIPEARLCIHRVFWLRETAVSKTGFSEFAKEGDRIPIFGTSRCLSASRHLASLEVQLCSCPYLLRVGGLLISVSLLLSLFFYLASWFFVDAQHEHAPKATNTNVPNTVKVRYVVWNVIN